jgi:hypothetical protein
MNTEDDGARGDAEQPQQPQPNGADQDAVPESSADNVTPPPAEPPVEPPPADQPSAEQLGAETAMPGEPAAPGADSAEPADAATSADEAAADEGAAAFTAEEPAGHEAKAEDRTETPRESADDTGAAGSGPPADEYARRFLESVDGFLGSMFREASEFVERTSRRPTPPPRAERERPPEDYAGRVLDSVEGWMGDFFRGASMARTAAGFGRAAAGSAFRNRQRPDDVWAQVTSAQESDASRECRYCPFCQTMAVVRNSRPELYEQIGDTAKTLLDLMRQAAEQSRRPRR